MNRTRWDIIYNQLISNTSAPTYLMLLKNPLQPLDCPMGTFCIGGVAWNVSTIAREISCLVFF